MSAVLTSLDNVKQFMGLTGVTDDALLTRMISASSGFIEQWTNRDFGLGNYTDDMDGTGGNFIFASQRPVQSVSSLSIDGFTIPLSTGVNSPGYYVTPDGFGLRGYTFTRTRGARNVTVSYSAGYNTIPREIEQACIDLVSFKYRERDRIGLASKGLAGETTAFVQTDMPENMQTILQAYKRVVPA